MADLYDRLIAYASAPGLYDPPSREELKQLAELYNVAKVEIAPALRRMAKEINLCAPPAWQDHADTLDACAEDLERLTT